MTVSTQAAPPVPVLELGMRAQLESLYAEREKLAESLGASDADEVVALVEGLRAEADDLRGEVASLRRLLGLLDTQRRLDAERDAVQAELARLREAVGVAEVPS